MLSVASGTRRPKQCDTRLVVDLKEVADAAGERRTFLNIVAVATGYSAFARLQITFRSRAEKGLEMDVAGRASLIGDCG